MKALWQRSLVLAIGVAALGWLLRRWGLALPLVMIVAVPIAVIANFLPWIGVRWLDALLMQLRRWHWRREQGHHHAFAGIPLQVEDDGRHVWIHGGGLQRVLHSSEPDDVFAARHSGRWRRDASGALLIRVDAVVAQLASAPGRMEPRTVRLRRYLERELMFPAEQRLRRHGGRRR